MARTKATPVRREVSEEYFTREMRPRKGAVEKGVETGAEKGKTVIKEVGGKKEAGVMEVAIAVGGIYASL